MSTYRTVDAFLAGAVAAGLGHVVMSPGLRSTPLSVTARRRPDIETHIVIDERAAAFMALGLAKATREPVALICTSGTAGANYHPAIIEAELSRVPLLVITADRPPELHGWDAGQTIDQIEMFGRHVRDFTQMPLGSLPPGRAARMGFRAVATATAVPAGPVHVNWPFREPLEPDLEWYGAHPEPVPALAATQVAIQADVSPLEALVEHERGLIVAGPADLAERDVASIADVSAATGWPIVADPLSGLRSAAMPGPVLDASDHLFKVEAFVDRLVPDVIVRVGDTPTSKAYRLWVERVAPERVILVDHRRRWADASASFTTLIPAPPAALGRLFGGRVDRRATEWTGRWEQANRIARKVVEAQLASDPLLELGATAAVVGSLAAGSALVVASSMPVRNLDMAMPAGDRSLRVLANRGANGIDGTVATAAGIAAGHGPTTLLTGDLAFLHDLGGLIAAARLNIPMNVVVLNNDGGGIFSLLPIADALERARFEELYRTAHGLDLAHASRLVGAAHIVASSRAELESALTGSGGDLRVIEVPIDPDANVAQVRSIDRQVREALA